MTDDWTRRAEREAVALLDGYGLIAFLTREHMLTVIAAAWLQGVNYGCHESLSGVEASFEQMRARL